jgi:hypothetical protein
VSSFGAAREGALLAGGAAGRLDGDTEAYRRLLQEVGGRASHRRERWLEFLLGAALRIDEYGLADEPAQPLPLAFAEALRIDLGPASAIRP